LKEGIIEFEIDGLRLSVSFPEAVIVFPLASGVASTCRRTKGNKKQNKATKGIARLLSCCKKGTY
jgi:hypothetical protein